MTKIMNATDFMYYTATLEDARHVLCGGHVLCGNDVESVVNVRLKAASSI